MDFQHLQPKDNVIQHRVIGKPWEIVETDIFQINDKNYLCIVDYFSTFLIIN